MTIDGSAPGADAGVAGVTPGGRDMQQHVTILAAFHLVFGVLGLVAALAIVVIFGGALGAISLGADTNPDAQVAMPIVGLIGVVALMVVLTLSIPGLVAGYGLLRRKSWARILTIVLSVLHLINVPFGTVLAIYGLWVLLSREGEQLFLAPATRAT